MAATLAEAVEARFTTLSVVSAAVPVHVSMLVPPVAPPMVIVPEVPRGLLEPELPILATDTT